LYQSKNLGAETGQHYTRRARGLRTRKWNCARMPLGTSTMNDVVWMKSCISYADRQPAVHYGEKSVQKTLIRGRCSNASQGVPNLQHGKKERLRQAAILHPALCQKAMLRQVQHQADDSRLAFFECGQSRSTPPRGALSEGDFNHRYQYHCHAGQTHKSRYCRGPPPRPRQSGKGLQYPGSSTTICRERG
jgi:hypothetical protein